MPATPDAPTLTLGSGSEPRASIIIATARQAERLKRCLTALAQHTRDIDYEVVIVLNEADEDVVSLVRRGVRGATVVSSDVNLGFAGACNLGRRHAQSDLLVLLHDDAEVADGWLPALMSAADEHPSAGAIGALIVRPEGDVQLSGGALFSDGSAAWIATGLPADHPEARVPRIVDYCSAACQLVRARVWDAIGGLEEDNFPAGYVDADLALAVNKAGWTVRVEPRAVVWHPAPGTMPDGFRAWVHARNRERFCAKWAHDLPGYEPPGDRGEEVVGRALARARARAESAVPSLGGPPTSNVRGDAAREAGHRELRLLREYVSETDAWTLELRADVERLHEEARRAHAAAADTAAELTETHARASHEIGARDEALAALQAEIADLRAQVAALRAERAAGVRGPDGVS